MITKPTKWTEEKVLKEFKEMLALAKKNKGILLKSELIENKSYSINMVNNWVNQYQDNTQINETMGQINGLLRDRCLKGAISNKYNAVMSKFHLNVNHGMQEKTSNDINMSGKFTIENIFNDIPDEDEEENG